MKEYKGIEDSENKIITQSGMFGNEVGPGVLQSSVRQTRMLQEYQRQELCATDCVDSVRVVLSICRLYVF